MTMLFSQRDRLDLEDETISGMNEGQLCGQSCFRIYPGIKVWVSECEGIL